ncbi:S1-like domain-containing RNA-binding protein [Desulfosporosinus sp. PR]|uniref:CvfB family protein n=1 Tax=Candidatus Desulfosporosinus nitrosoreducens TaxID=3401928 RepID=UPI0027EF7ACE|nr:S1-like domain-containing RNA-binding protein [Desulfosporosinus sp. PR]MDQ7094535.1 S1-like domain-containing RNA-binding protein [Desulfosporosinus sp. PR]
MIEIGKLNQLKINNFTSFGAYLDAGTGIRSDNILLPIKQVPEGAQEGEVLEVFIYRDSEERLIATRQRPLALVGDLAYLKVNARTRIGAFLDIGLERGLFLPFQEQKFPIEVGKSYLVKVYLDKSQRLCATTEVYEYLTTNSPYQKNDKVAGVVYRINLAVGVFVAVDNKYFGMIPNNECFKELHEGDRIEARVIRVRDDGKLDLSPRELSYLQMDKDSEAILEGIRNAEGFLPLNDKSNPLEIENRLKMSKAAFKRALGKLLKENKVVKAEDGLREKR